MTNIFKRLCEKEKRRKRNEELVNKKIKALSLQDRNAYNQIIKREEKDYCENTYSFIVAVPSLIFYLAVTAFVLKLFLDIDVISSLMSVSIALIKIWIPLIALGVILDFIGMNKLDKLKRGLLKI